MLVQERKITLDEYMAMPIGAPYQYINGCLVDWPSRTPIHQITLGGLITCVFNFENRNPDKGIFIMGSIEVIFDNQNSFQPDLVFISKERQEILKDYVYGAPDMIVEILWEKNAYYDLRPKKDVYEKYAVKEYIIIDPIAQNADLYILKEGIYHLHQKAQKTEQLNSALLPGLAIDLQKVFK